VCRMHVDLDVPALVVEFVVLTCHPSRTKLLANVLRQYRSRPSGQHPPPLPFRGCLVLLQHLDSRRCAKLTPSDVAVATVGTVATVARAAVSIAFAAFTERT
jgi:hypothetical protein